jgi:hypothetical protein
MLNAQTKHNDIVNIRGIMPKNAVLTQTGRKAGGPHQTASIGRRNDAASSTWKRIRCGADKKQASLSDSAFQKPGRHV